jgi:hypoxanthine phosphoribosyltransferase
MISKKYISPDRFQEDVWRLAAKARSSGWKPDMIIALWRGGATVGISVHEFFKATGWTVNHIPLKCSSYTGIGENEGDVVFTLGDEVFSMIKPGNKVLVVDDVFDTGKSAKAMKTRLENSGAEMKLAVVYWKSANNTTDMKPDFYVEDMSEEWIVFPHELAGLTSDELAAKNPFLASLADDALRMRDF